MSEEKSVEGITSKLFEAKTIKGYLAYEIMAQLISPDRLGALVHPLKTVSLVLGRDMMRGILIWVRYLLNRSISTHFFAEGRSI